MSETLGNSFLAKITENNTERKQLYESFVKALANAETCSKGNTVPSKSEIQKKSSDETADFLANYKDPYHERLHEIETEKNKTEA